MNQIQGGAHFYRCYETRDGEYMAVGAVENKFYAQLIEGLGLDPTLVATQNDQSKWPALQTELASVFATKTRAEWEQVFAPLDACVTPVLSMAEAMEYPHNTERDAFVEAHGYVQVAPPVRFGRTPATIGGPTPQPGADNERILAELGYSPRRDREAPVRGGDRVTGMPDRLEIPPLPETTILLVEVGSTAHGTGIPGGEDHDEMGVVVESPEQLVGLDEGGFRTVMQRTQPDGMSLGPGRHRSDVALAAAVSPPRGVRQPLDLDDDVGADRVLDCRRRGTLCAR